ncbi:Uncharacterized protein APZ42_007535 [Daphnia magna]|uniref:Uncharacterized protein n=1 Tax=Daphnia magna TaxID=35525 RepID=A0A164F8A2_9CRUS|nr:Uncharacterized protein APZ42_007535 [Daphnia magna]
MGRRPKTEEKAAEKTDHWRCLACNGRAHNLARCNVFIPDRMFGLILVKKPSQLYRPHWREKDGFCPFNVDAGGGEDNCAYEDTTEEAVFINDNSQQVEHQWECSETVSQF